MADHAVETHLDKGRQKQKQAAEFGPHRTALVRQGPHVGTIGLDRLDRFGAFFIGASRQLGKAFLFEQLANSHRRSLNVLCLQRSADVVDGQVLFSQANDFLPDVVVGLDAGPRFVDKKLALRVAPKLVGQLVEAAHGVSETTSDFGGGALLDEISPQSLVLPLGRVLWSEEDLGQIHLANSYLKSSASTVSE